MIKTIKISAFIAALLFLIGTFFKTSHWPGASVLLVVGTVAGLLSFVAIISLLLGNLTSGFEQFNGISASLVLILSFFAFLFKSLHWPGAAKLIWIADIGILFSAVFFLVDGLREKDRLKYAFKLITGFFILLLALAIFLVR